MTESLNLYMALAHYPVAGKNGKTIASALTNLDLHDMSRLARTYGARKFYVVTPLSDQRELGRRILEHWTSGPGGVYNPMRKEALDLAEIADSLEAAVSDIARRRGQKPRVVATTADADRANLSFGALREKLAAGEPCLLVFGTAWGLADECFRAADHVLSPIKGRGDYNHLPVRCAAAIILDRLAGPGSRRVN
ncbi:conserved hypothetical protein [Candidatus Desulfarcum epimagneticum]|uniref:tRNA (guanine-N(1)-)-methyltransferase C-terminal domain-containing protein n=1 Tax=uncultured Desulfobacteraceae bacterium TaxID=218296 RepID=A0A484HFA2_9BACT|nr:conserved hypothetical protein [uncultured Desulfobacteraceae bacterium]